MTMTETGDKEVAVINVSTDSGLVARIVEAMKSVFAPLTIAAIVPDLPTAIDATTPIASTSSFKLWKEKDGEGDWRWLMWVSNHWRDREKEVIPGQAHRDFVDYLDKSGEEAMPEAWLWHTPGTRWGKADFADFADGFLIISGTVDPGMEGVAEALEKEQEELGVSHGFHYDYDEKGKDGGVIAWYKSFEVSPLPWGAAANPWTGMDVIRKELAMGLSSTKRAWLEGKLGKERVGAIEADTAGMRKALEDAGVDFKDLEAIADPPATAAEVAAEVEKAVKAVTSIADVLEGLKAAGEQTTAAIKSMGERLTALEKSDDEKVAATFKAKATPGAEKGFRASQSESTVLGDGDDKGLKEAAPVVHAGFAASIQR